jgi:hypothetical protein
VAEAVWDGIISVEDHQQLRALLAGNLRPPGSRVRKHFLSGFVFCSDCADKDVKMKLKYKCLSDVGGCNGRVIGLTDLEEWIGHLMVAKLLDPRTLAEVAAHEAERGADVEVILDKIAADERRLGKLRQQLEDADEDEIPEVTDAIRSVRHRVKGLREELARSATTAPALVRESFQEMAECWTDLDLDQKQAVLRMFVDRILIYPAVRGRARFDPDRVRVVPVRRRGRGGE